MDHFNGSSCPFINTEVIGNGRFWELFSFRTSPHKVAFSIIFNRTCEQNENVHFKDTYMRGLTMFCSEHIYNFFFVTTTTDTCRLEQSQESTSSVSLLLKF